MHTVSGSERVTYHNNAPDALGYLWFQLDQNIDNPDVSEEMIGASALPKNVSTRQLAFINARLDTKGYTISRVPLVSKTGQKTTVPFVLQGTQMKVPLSIPIATGQTQDVEIDWSYVTPESFASRNGRGAREKQKGGWEYLAAQSYPRAAVYDDVNGWQNDQFYGEGEFYLNFGNYDVSITVPHNHIVQATGVLQNPTDVLTATQRDRLAKAFTSENQVFIITKDEANTRVTRHSRSWRTGGHWCL